MPSAGFEPTISAGERPQPGRPLGPAKPVTSTCLISLPKKYSPNQDCANLPLIQQQPQNSKRQKGDTKQVPYRGRTNIRRQVFVHSWSMWAEFTFLLSNCGVSKCLRSLDILHTRFKFVTFKKIRTINSTCKYYFIYNVTENTLVE